MVDRTMVTLPCIHTNTPNCFCIDYYSLYPCYAHRDSLNEAYQYVITARLQSDPVEGCFLVKAHE